MDWISRCGEKQNPCSILGSWVNYGFLGEMGVKGRADYRQEDKKYTWGQSGFRLDERLLTGDDGK